MGVWVDVKRNTQERSKALNPRYESDAVAQLVWKFAGVALSSLELRAVANAISLLGM